jgi:hypothetical protein
MRDISKSQFESKMQKYGFVKEFMGYWKLPEPCSYVSVCSLNGGEKYRYRLAYMLAAYDKHLLKPTTGAQK